MAWSGFAYNFCIESKTLLLVRGAFHLREPCDVGTHISQMRPKLRINLIGVCENPSCRFAPKTAPKRGWNGSALYGTSLYTWDKNRSEPWYAIPPSPTKQHCNAQTLMSREALSFWSVWFSLAAVFLALYYAVWLRYFIGGREITLLSRSFLFVPMPLAVFPVLYFLCAAIWLHNLPAAIIMVIFGAAHLAVSIQSFR